MSFKQNPVSIRFLEVLKTLKRAGAFVTYAQFAKSIEFSPQSLNEILKGRRDVTVEMLRKLFIKYGVDAGYVFDFEMPLEQVQFIKSEPIGETSIGVDVIDIYLGNVKPMLTRIEEVIKSISIFISANGKIQAIDSVSDKIKSFKTFEKNLLKSLQTSDEKELTKFREELFTYYQAFLESYFRLVDLLTQVLSHQIPQSLSTILKENKIDVTQPSREKTPRKSQKRKS